MGPWYNKWQIYDISDGMPSVVDQHLKFSVVKLHRSTAGIDNYEKLHERY